MTPPVGAQSALKALGLPSSREYVKNIMQQYDTDGDGTVRTPQCRFVSSFSCSRREWGSAAENAAAASSRCTDGMN